MFGDSNHIKVKFCTVGVHRSDGLVKKLVLSVTFRVLTEVQDFQNYTLQDAISKIIWNLRSSYQSKIKNSSFELNINSKPNTIW